MRTSKHCDPNIDPFEIFWPGRSVSEILQTSKSSLLCPIKRDVESTEEVRKGKEELGPGEAIEVVHISRSPQSIFVCISSNPIECSHRSAGTYLSPRQLLGPFEKGTKNLCSTLPRSRFSHRWGINWSGLINACGCFMAKRTPMETMV